jgi:hypothetical protein
MVERVIYALIYICGIALSYFLIIWVLGAIGLHLPAMVLNIMLVVLVLVAILVLWRLFAGAGIRLWPGP